MSNVETVTVEEPVWWRGDEDAATSSMAALGELMGGAQR